MKCNNCKRNASTLYECESCGRIACEACWGKSNSIVGTIISRIFSIKSCPYCNGNNYSVVSGISTFEPIGKSVYKKIDKILEEK